ncbi:MAG: SUMF1/EgtB/PvdO family nonheme iron enzyme [Candidatus Hydrogenedentes bacterium]|nr:SUMF1/EgtB/PvdO family nonheme iron enzyme [Candidatus Hydrogenedentota bacterium]
MNKGRRLVSRRWILPVCVVLAVTGCGGSKDDGVTATLFIETTPVEGAVVMVDNVLVGESPCTVDGLSPGPVLVEVQKERFENKWETVRIPDEGGEVRIQIEMEPQVGYLTIKSTPSGARVTLDGAIEIGETPLVGKAVPVGEHTYEVEKENYEKAVGVLDVQPDYRYKRVEELKPKLASLEVYTVPTGAQIWINNQLQRERTAARFDLPQGTYVISVFVKGYVTGERVVTLGPNEKSNLEFALEEGDAPAGMVLVPAAEFIMGVDDESPDERPKRTLWLDAFYIDKYEVTNEQFKAVFPSHTFKEGRETYPAGGISWNQAVAYAAAVGKRLPTETEWERAARGVDGREYPWGAKFQGSLCNIATTSNPQPCKVGQFRAGASPAGCFDMAGNIYEWTSSWYEAYPGNVVIEKDYGQVFRVLRGGSYKAGAFDARCARRHYARMDATREDYGFRCAADVAGSSKPGRP